MATIQKLSQDMTDLKTTLLDQLSINKKDVFDKVASLEDVVSSTAKELNDAIFHVREHVLKMLREENVSLRDRLHTLEARQIKMERQLNRVEQNHRKSNLELDGIPQSVTQDELKTTVVKIVNSISPTKIDVNDVEAVHRLPSKRNPQPVIVRMKRNHIDSVHSNRKKLKNVVESLDLQGSGIYVNHNLSPNMKSIEFNARKLLKDGLISGAWFSNMSVRVKCLNGKVLSIGHEFELYENFPGYENFSFDCDFYDRVLNNDMIEAVYTGINEDVVTAI